MLCKDRSHIIIFTMGGNQPKGQKPTAAQVEDSSFFKKQMIIHSQVLSIEKKYTLE